MYSKPKHQYSLNVLYFVETVKGTRGSPSIVFQLLEAQHHELFQSLMELDWSITSGVWVPMTPGNTTLSSYHLRGHLRNVEALKNKKYHFYP